MLLVPQQPDPEIKPPRAADEESARTQAVGDSAVAPHSQSGNNGCQPGPQLAG